MPSPERLAAVFEYALLVAAEADTRWERALGETHLLKYAYLADWAYARRHGETYTGCPWKFYHFGPWAQMAQASIKPTMAAINASAEEGETDEGHHWVRYHLEANDTELRELRDALPAEVSRAIRLNVRKFGPHTNDLLDFVYRTVPMLRAKPNEALDLTVGPPERESAAPVESISNKAKKRRLQRLREGRAQLAKLFAERRAFETEPTPDPPPRYDQVFREGQEWLDSLAGPAIEEGEGDLIIDDSVWKEPRGGELP